MDITELEYNNEYEALDLFDRGNSSYTFDTGCYVCCLVLFKVLPRPKIHFRESLINNEKQRNI
jgi:hypothetical protein